MAFKKFRKMKVYEASGYNYKRTPSIILIRKDIIQGIVNGIKSCIGKVKYAVTNVAETIRSFLHFSVPDEGPLTDYESWMPDFMSGLAKGIEQSKNMVAKAVEGVAGDMVISPQMAVAESRFATPSESVMTSFGLSFLCRILMMCLCRR